MSAASPVQEEQDSFRPLVGRPADQSSCLTAEQRDWAPEPPLGQPSAHSSLIGQLPGSQPSASLDRSGWDSALTRMTGGFAGQPLDRWRPWSSERSSTWLDGGPGESRMEPLLQEPDQSAGQQVESWGK